MDCDRKAVCAKFGSRFRDAEVCIAEFSKKGKWREELDGSDARGGSREASVTRLGRCRTRDAPGTPLAARSGHRGHVIPL